MATLQVHLENGFDHDRVVVGAGDAEHVEADATTRYQIGLAAVVLVTVPDGEPCDLRVALPDRGLDAAVRVDPARTPHVRVDVRGDEVVVRPSAAPPMLA